LLFCLSCMLSFFPFIFRVTCAYWGCLSIAELLIAFESGAK
jgi:hypothetical protein